MIALYLATSVLALLGAGAVLDRLLFHSGDAPWFRLSGLRLVAWVTLGVAAAYLVSMRSPLVLVIPTAMMLQSRRSSSAISTTLTPTQTSATRCLAAALLIVTAWTFARP